MKYLMLLALISCTAQAWYTVDYDPCDVAGIERRMRDKIDRDYPPLNIPRRTHTIVDYNDNGNVYVNGSDGYRGQGFWENGSFHYYEY